MVLTSGRLAAVHAGQSNCPTLDCVLAGLVAFRDDPQFATELLGWHGGKLYAARGSASEVTSTIPSLRVIVTDVRMNTTHAHMRT
jgi:hypothetical protein